MGIYTYLQFKVDKKYSVATNLTIQDEDSDNAVTFSNVMNNISSRTRTVNATNWQPVPWTVVGESGPAQQTPNIASVIQEIVNRPGWVAGNSLALIVTGMGERVAESYNGDQAGAPLLHIEYYVTGQQPPTVNAGSDQAANGDTAVLDGMVTDDGLPNPPGAVTTLWTVVSGPGTVTFGEATAVDNNATFSAPGSYVLRLTADDSN